MKRLGIWRILRVADYRDGGKKELSFPPWLTGVREELWKIQGVGESIISANSLFFPHFRRAYLLLSILTIFNSRKIRL
jgi:hypothetical protein